MFLITIEHATLKPKTKNTGGRMGGASAAGVFLSKFVSKTPWIHLDIAGTAFLDKPNAEGIKNATGIGVRSLIKYITSLN